MELERALDAGCAIIIVEPSRLGDETARWISVGNCLHKTAVLSGIFSIGSGKLFYKHKFLANCLGSVYIYSIKHLKCSVKSTLFILVATHITWVLYLTRLT